jgi:hypothetical protein
MRAFPLPDECDNNTVLIIEGDRADDFAVVAISGLGRNAPGGPLARWFVQSRRHGPRIVSREAHVRRIEPSTDALVG